ncbi:hypothetical protein GOBAR_AA16108 [Gossypium barbadense]|uniref:C2 NT-type domain-containing protein n=1 Tax=Gossypium barbadense TaxID=3634 RepID=A0A2P5XMG4_GOSBA|nr:hypothetical protein GOBAR_AA16108 [Gossypium barbadense]
MVVKMMRWRPWPPLLSKKYEVKLIVRRLEGWDPVRESTDKPEKLTVEIRWKGPKASLSSLRRTVKRNFTKEADAGDQNGVVLWDEEFQTLCSLSAYKENVFHPWEITFSVLNGLNQGAKNKFPLIIGTASMNLGEYASSSEQKEFELNVPLTVSAGATKPGLQLSISLSLLELRAAQETVEPVQRALVPIVASPLPVSMEKDEVSAIKAGLRKVKIFTEYVSTRTAKKACREDEGSEGRCSARSDDGEYPLDTDSLDEFDEGESDEGKDDSVVRKSFSYGTLAYANFAGGSFYSSLKIEEGEDWVYYSNCKSDVGCSNVEDSATSVSEPSLLQSSKRSILPWRKRKLSFRSPKAKGEPLLKKSYGEEGGDDIDFDRRQLSSDESLALGWHKDEDSSGNRSSVSEFGDDNFAVGTWEQKEVTARWNGGISVKMRPIGSGSPTSTLISKTVLQAKIRPLTVVPRKSFIGFFHPEGMDEEKFDFLHGAMSFDNIWDEINRAGEECLKSGESHVYIVSWNDHFFILKVEPEAYYIIDTLGERLYEGCNQAYILKFDNNTVIHKLPNATQSSDEKPTGDQQVAPATTEPKISQAEQVNGKEEGSVSGSVVTKPAEPEEVVCQGKESCKEYIKSFLAAIPIREMQADIKKGLMASTPLHQRLQIEFHYTEFWQPKPETSATPMTTTKLLLVEVPLTEVAA